jgi:hypothetical protein
VAPPVPDPAALARGLHLAADGAGPLVQRDYWCVIRGCRHRPAALIGYLRRHFAELPPERLAAFRAPGGAAEPLGVGDEMEIGLPGAGRVRVRVVHVGAHMLTVATLRGHPVAGRITFGAYPNARGDVVFHIRSRSRAASALHRLGHFLAGDAMQSTTWIDFIDHLANTVGEGVIGAIHEDACRVPAEVERDDAPLTPTFHTDGE